MVITTFGQVYLIVSHLGHGGWGESFLAERASGHRRCLLIRIKNEAVIKQTAAFFYSQADNRAFTDFEECAVDNEALLLVFSWPSGQSLEEKLGKEHCTVPERLAIARKALERVILQDMSFYFAACCLDVGNIYVTRGLDVSFLYRAEGAEGAGEADKAAMREVKESFGRLLAFLFTKELEKGAMRPLADFIRGLDGIEAEGYLGLYRYFQAMQEEVMALSEEELAAPGTWVFRAWGKVTKCFRPLKRIAAFVLLAAGLVYMVWGVSDARRPAPEARVLESIGTLEIR